MPSWGSALLWPTLGPPSASSASASLRQPIAGKKPHVERPSPAPINPKSGFACSYAVTSPNSEFRIPNFLDPPSSVHYIQEVKT
jgi:hypothetical protein